MRRARATHMAPAAHRTGCYASRVNNNVEKSSTSIYASCVIIHEQHSVNLCRIHNFLYLKVKQDVIEVVDVCPSFLYIRALRATEILVEISFNDVRITYSWRRWKKVLILMQTRDLCVYREKKPPPCVTCDTRSYWTKLCCCHESECQLLVYSSCRPRSSSSIRNIIMFSDFLWPV